MAEQSNTSNTVMDRIRSHFTTEGKCDVDIAKYQSAVSIIPCSGNVSCWTTIACQQETTIPLLDREMIEVDSIDVCTLFDGNGESWKEYVPDSTRSMGEFTQPVYYNPDRFDILFEASGAQQSYIVLVEVNDPRHTQFAFRAHLKSMSASFVSNSDSSVSMIDLTWQPTGEPFVTEGVDINVCA